MHLSHVRALFEHAEWRTKCEVSNDVEGYVVEPVQRIKLVVSAIGLLAPAVPLRGQLLKIVVNVLLKLANGLRAECVRDDLALSCVLGSVTGVEEAALDGDEGIVIITMT